MLGWSDGQMPRDGQMVSGQRRFRWQGAGGCLQQVAAYSLHTRLSHRPAHLPNQVKEGEEPPTKTVPRTTNVWDKINVAKPLWMRPPKEVTEDEYAEFYKSAFKQYDTPQSYVHFSLEGQVEFRAMLFVPSAVPWELSQDMFNEKVRPHRH